MIFPLKEEIRLESSPTYISLLSLSPHLSLLLFFSLVQPEKSIQEGLACIFIVSSLCASCVVVIILVVVTAVVIVAAIAIDVDVVKTP